MIKTNELRLGNILEWNKENFNVCTIYKDGVENELYCKPLNELHPIILNEECLVKFGFASNEYKDEFYKSYIHLDCEYTGHNTFNVLFKGLKLSIDVKYVHQLQNLYFALTGEELKMND